MSAALLSCEKLARAFIGWGFIMSTCKPCTWNQMLEEKQMTALFHIDDLILAYIVPHLVANLIKLLDGAHGAQDPLTATR